jgi:hypothetical protein
MRGASFYVDPATVRNHYQLRLLNKRNQPVEFRVSLENPPAGFNVSGANEPITLSALGEANRPLIVLQNRENYAGPVKLTLLIQAEPGKATIRQAIQFLGPNPQS